MKLIATNDKAEFYVSDMSEHLTEYAQEKLGKNFKVIIAKTLKDGDTKYLLLDKQQPVFDSRLAEDIAVHVDIMKLQRNHQ